MSKDLSNFNHIDLLFHSDYLRAADLRNKDVTVTIQDIEPQHELIRQGGQKDVKPVIKIEESPKMWVLNKTNAKQIASLHGKEVMEWIGKRVTIFSTEISAGGEMVMAIRVRPSVPQEKQDD